MPPALAIFLMHLQKYHNFAIFSQILMMFGPKCMKTKEATWKIIFFKFGRVVNFWYYNFQLSEQMQHL